MQDPYFLCPESYRNKMKGKWRKEELDQIGTRYEADIKKPTMPFVMAAINCKVVRRSAALTSQTNPQQSPYGENFAYNEAAIIKYRLLGRLLSFVMAMFMFVAVLIKPLPRLLAKCFTAGHGPSKANMARNRFSTIVVGRGEEGGAAVTVEVRGGDPGYIETSKMLAESALCVALDQDHLPNQAGVLTPASGLGLRLVSRLHAKGITFTPSP